MQLSYIREDALQLRNLPKKGGSLALSQWIEHRFHIKSSQKCRQMRRKYRLSKNNYRSRSINEKGPSIHFYCILDVCKNYYVEGKYSHRAFSGRKAENYRCIKAKGSIHSLQIMNTLNEKFDNLIRATVILAKRIGIDPERVWKVSQVKEVA